MGETLRVDDNKFGNKSLISPLSSPPGELQTADLFVKNLFKLFKNNPNFYYTKIDYIGDINVELKETHLNQDFCIVSGT